MKKNYLILILITVSIFQIPFTPCRGGVWDIEIKAPRYDPLWEKIKTLSKDHRDIKKIDRILSTACTLKRKYPEKAAPLLWLAWAYNQKALRCDCEREEQRRLNKKAIYYAKKSYSKEKTRAAFKIFASSISAFKNIDAIKKEHGGWIKECAPLPYGRGLPELEDMAQWKKIAPYWDKRSNIKSAMRAVEMFKNIADKKKGDLTANLWASRGFYYLGSYYAVKDDDKKAVYYFKKGTEYGKRSIDLSPYNLPANYWYFLNFGRTMEYAGIFEQTINAKSMLKYIVFCFRENMMYFYFGPVMIAGGAIARGGWLTRNILEMLGYHLNDVLTALDMAEILYPDYFRIQSCKAEIYFNTGQKEKARKILISLLKKDPAVNRIHEAENRVVLMAAKKLIAGINGKNKK